MLFSVGVVKISPCENSRTFVNGKLVTESTVLRSGECWNWTKTHQTGYELRVVRKVWLESKFVLCSIFQGLVLSLETIMYSDLIILIKVCCFRVSFASLMRDLVRKLDILFTLSPAREERIRQSRSNLMEDINGTLTSVPFLGLIHTHYAGEI